MGSRSLSFLPLLVLLTVSILTCTRAQGDVDSLNVDLNQICDNGEFGVEKDLGPDTNWKCHNSSLIKQSYMKPSPAPTCSDTTHYSPTFKCINDPLIYSEHPPLVGDYRPVAPQYGEYKYLPPQRWLHALRLGAVAFLYHPCTPQEQVTALRDLAHSCLWKHVITPYPHLSKDKPLALVSWGCIYRMEWVESHLVRAWLEQNALKTDESLGYSIGTYSKGLVLESDHNLPPNIVCPDVRAPSPETTPHNSDISTQSPPCSNNSIPSGDVNKPTPVCNKPTTVIVLESSRQRLTVLLALVVVILLLAMLLVIWRLWVSCSFKGKQKGKYKSVSKYFPVALGKSGSGMAIPEMGMPKDGLAEREKLLDESDEDEL